MSDTAGARSHPNGWPPEADRARLHFVSGKGGTGKSTVAAALALALAAGGRKVLLVEVEGRQGIAQLFDVPPLEPVDTKVASAEGGGEVYALAVDIETAFLEYLEMFYNLGFAARAIRRVGAIEFATTIAPGLRDVLLTGKVKERAVRTEKDGRPLYDEIVVDSPPTGRIGSFLDVTTAMRDLAKTGPVRSQSEGVVRLLHSDQTVVHLVTLLEALPVQETADAAAELATADLRLGTIVVNRSDTSFLPEKSIAEAAAGRLDASVIRAKLGDAGITLSDDDFAGLLTESIEHASTLSGQRESERRLGDLDVPRLTLPALADGMDLGGLYELAEYLTKQGVR
ncbi:MAG: ArsA-related P-loop ATPase [Rhodococcus sp. (in: high G+C Gram-positive bacteria)]